MPAAAIPVAASLAAPAVGGALTAATGATLAPWLTAAAGGALTGGLGSYIMGQDPMKGALFGGLGGGLSSATGLSDKIGSIFGGGDAASAAGDLSPEAAAAGIDPGVAQGVNAAGDSVSLNSPNLDSFAAPPDGAAMSAASDTAKTGSLLGSMGKIGPFAALTLGGLALNKATGLKPMDNTSKLSNDYKAPQPMNRQYTAVDPNSFLTNSANRTFYNNVNPQVQYARGGAVKCMADGGSISESDNTNAVLDSIAAQGRNALDSGAPASHPAVKAFVETFGDPAQQEVDRAISGRKINPPRRYANGGSIRYMAHGGGLGVMMPQTAANPMPQMASPVSMGDTMPQTVSHPMPHPASLVGTSVNGPGNGMSDSIPAKLSDGEFVFSAPAVSALGNGSNKAGTKNLQQMHKNILKRHFRGKEPKKALGLSSYMH